MALDYLVYPMYFIHTHIGNASLNEQAFSYVCNMDMSSVGEDYFLSHIGTDSPFQSTRAALCLGA